MKNSLLIILLSLFVYNANATDYYLKSSGVINTTSSWGILTDGTGTAPTSFTSTADIWHFSNRATLLISSPFVAVTGALVVIEAGINVTIISVPAGVKIKSKINIASTGTLTVNNADLLAFNVLDPNSTVVFNFATQTIKPTYYGNVIIQSSIKLDGSPGGDIGINGLLTINASRVLTMNGYGILFFGPKMIAGAGTITGDNTTSFLAFYGGDGTNAGTLNFTAGSARLNGFYMFAANVNSFVRLGTDLSIENTGVFWQSTGSVDLNGRTLTIDNTSDANFAGDNVSGGIIGSVNSSLIINGGIGTYSGLSSLFMTASSNVLKVLSVNSVSPLNLGNMLNITDSLAVNNSSVSTSGNLTLKSTASLKGRVSEIKGTGSVSGNINVEAFYNAGFAGWETVGPAGVSGLTASNWDGGSGSATGIAMTCNGCINNEYSAGGSYFVSIQSDPTGTGIYNDLVASSPLTPAQGYWMYVASDLVSAIDVTQTTSGAIVTGAKTMASSFVSNPYPSPVSADRLKSHNSTMGAVYVWDPDAGAHVSYNSGVGSPKLANGGIAMGQGFYIDGLALTFIESDKVAYNTSANALLKTTTANVGSVFQLNINGTNSDVDNTYFRYHQNATNNYDLEFDAYKKFATPGYVGYPGVYNKYTTISSKFNNIDYSINSLPYPTTANMVMPILVKVMSTGYYTISATDLANLPINTCVTLKDKLLNIDHDLTTGPYICNISDSTSIPRFELTVCSSVATGLDNTSSNVNQHNTIISQDVNGAFVKTNFASSTKATISAYNVMGQKIMLDKEIEGTDLITHLDLNIHNQVVIIRVTSAKENTTKKIFVN